MSVGWLGADTKYVIHIGCQSLFIRFIGLHKDLTGGTGLLESRGNGKTTRIVARLDRSIGEVVEAHDHEGQVVRTSETVPFPFPDPVGALSAALELQRGHQIRLAR